MLRGYNHIKFYENKALQRWLTADIEDYVTIFETNTIPSFVLISDTAFASASGQIYNAKTDETIGNSFSITVTVNDDSKQLKYLGSSLVDQDCGYYYIKITAGGDEYYSEVFGWQDDVSELLKITSTSSNITLAGKYEIDLTGITYTSYYFAESADTDSEIDEEGVEKPYGDIPVFNTRTLIDAFEILGTREIFEYVSGLRILKTNGTVNLTYKNISADVYDIQTEKKESTAFDEVVVITMKFKEEDYISARNEI